MGGLEESRRPGGPPRFLPAPSAAPSDGSGSFVRERPARTSKGPKERVLARANLPPTPHATRLTVSRYLCSGQPKALVRPLESTERRRTLFPGAEGPCPFTLTEYIRLSEANVLKANCLPRMILSDCLVPNVLIGRF